MTPDLIADHIARDIRDGLLHAGAALVQEDLARRYGVSRNPVREALRLLEARGVVVIRGGEGATVRELSQEDLDEVYALRIAIEPTIAQAIIDNCTKRSVENLSVQAVELGKVTDEATWLQQNYAFHVALYEMADKPRTRSVLIELLSATQPYSRRNVHQLGGREQADLDHLAMVAAIRDGDADGLADRLVRHLEVAVERLKSIDSAAGVLPR